MHRDILDILAHQQGWTVPTQRDLAVRFIEDHPEIAESWRRYLNQVKEDENSTQPMITLVELPYTMDVFVTVDLTTGRVDKVVYDRDSLDRKDEGVVTDSTHPHRLGTPILNTDIIDAADAVAEADTQWPPSELN